MKIIFYSNTDWFMYNFNRSIAIGLREEGHEILMVTPPGSYGEDLVQLGFRWFPAPMQRKSLNPFKEFLLVLWLVRLFKSEKPDIVHNFTLKCVLLGGIAAKLANVSSCVNELTGLGYVFTSPSSKARLLRFVVLCLFRFVLTYKTYSLILLNNADYEFFGRLNLVPQNRIYLVHGAGVDCNYYVPNNSLKEGSFRVALPARMLWDKGVGEFVKAAKILKAQGKDIEFWLVGNSDAGNPTSISEVLLREWSDSGIVKWLGHVGDMREVYHSVDLVTLPSYREGLPTSLTEAAACGLAIVASMVPGCADVVFNGINGCLVPVKNANALAAAISDLSEDPALCERYGMASREIALERFEKNIVFRERLAIYRNHVPCV